MEAIPESPVMQHRQDTLEQVRKMFDLDKPGQIDQAIDILQEWAKKQPHFINKEFDRVYLEGYIIRAKGSVEKAKERLDSMCMLRTTFSHFYKATKANELKNTKTILEFVLPKQTKDYCTVYFLKNHENNFGDAFLLNYFRRAAMYVDYLCKYDYNAGMIYVIDVTDTDLLKNMTALTSPFVRQSLLVFFKAYGARVRGLHILTNSKLVESIMNVLKPLLGDKVDRLLVHRNQESLFEHVDKDLMPAEYGGKEEPMHVLAEKMMDFLSTDEVMKYIEELNEHTVDTKIKPIPEEHNEYLGVSGSFRTLAVD
ncbi:hypothetical protein evm_007793 [Chilo suppressalis]|nr:hypothetical protein evm_007793 [Chilo suppressalis]